MKKILLMNNSLSTGGISASMINTANELSKIYDVSIYCFIPNGELKYRLSDRVHILDSSWMVMAMNSTLNETRKMGLKFFVWKMFSRVWSFIFNNRLPIYIALKRQPFLGYYDVACSYTHEANKKIEYTGLIRVLINKVTSPIKLSWVHCDCYKQKLSSFNDRYYNKVDGIVGVTNSVSNAFIDTHPNVKTNIYSCMNMLDYDKIYKLSEEPVNLELNQKGVICFSACRLSWIKGIERMIDCSSDIFIKNNVSWYIAGDGPDLNRIKSKIIEYNLINHIFLIGHQNNPFAFISKSDLYLSVSYEEAAPLVYLEAKALHVPVFSTRTLSTDELLDNSIDFICDNNNLSIREAFEFATCDKNILVERKRKNSGYYGSNNDSIKKFKYWIELSDQQRKGNKYEY